MPKKFDDLVSSIKQQLKKEKPKMSDKELSSKAYAIATAQWKKTHNGKSPTKEKVKDWKVLEFLAPITESVFSEESNEFFIRGVAINETTTLNNVKYIAEELEIAAPSFRNVPILLDHKNEIKSIVGRTTSNVNFNSINRRIDFEGKIMDNDIKEMIKDGRIQNVSIGAKVNDLIEESDGSKKAIGIKGLEISLVACPGDSGANLCHAIDNNLHIKEMVNVEEDVEVSEKELLDWAKSLVEEKKIKLVKKCGEKKKPKIKTMNSFSVNTGNCVIEGEGIVHSIKYKGGQT